MNRLQKIASRIAGEDVVGPKRGTKEWYKDRASRCVDRMKRKRGFKGLGLNESQMEAASRLQTSYNLSDDNKSELVSKLAETFEKNEVL